VTSKCSLFVDAGYLLASSASRLTGTSLRSGIHVKYRRLIRGLIKAAEETTGLPVLRVHWYDSAKDGVPDRSQERIGELPKVKLRLGRFGYDGQQKGVDLRLGLDMVTHAHHKAAEVFLLVSGDDDLTEAVEEVQVHGVSVMVLAVPSADGQPHGVSRHLVRAADEIITIDPEVIDESIIPIETPEQAADDSGESSEIPSRSSALSLNPPANPGELLPVKPNATAGELALIADALVFGNLGRVGQPASFDAAAVEGSPATSADHSVNGQTGTASDGSVPATVESNQISESLPFDLQDDGAEILLEGSPDGIGASDFNINNDAEAATLLSPAENPDISSPSLLRSDEVLRDDEAQRLADESLTATLLDLADELDNLANAETDGSTDPIQAGLLDESSVLTPAVDVDHPRIAVPEAEPPAVSSSAVPKPSMFVTKPRPGEQPSIVTETLHRFWPPTPRDVSSTIGRPVARPMRPTYTTGPVVHPQKGTWGHQWEEVIDSVVGRVLNSLTKSTTVDTWNVIGLGRPSIPQDIDKALLLDATEAMGVYTLSDAERHEVRAAFWREFDHVQR
jgi:uncharacterized LabA/DUF88 family protein